MTADHAQRADRRVLFVPPTAHDATTTEALFRRFDVVLEICASPVDLVREIETGAGAVLLPVEVLSPAATDALTAVLAGQPPWSDLPVLLLTQREATDAHADRVCIPGNVTLVDRPVRPATLMSAVHVALRARERQYQLRTHLLERARAEEALRLADQRKSEFIAVASHELRGPLASLLATITLLQMKAAADPDLHKLCDMIGRQAAHMTALVDDLLDVSRIETGKLRLVKRPVELNSLVQQALEACASALGRRQHTVTVTLPDTPIVIDGDATRIVQIVSNLLNNAAKYTRNGGAIDVSVTADDGSAVVRVRDHGVGIPADMLGRIFDRFVQLTTSDYRADDGLGIGLSLVRALVELHGGTVHAHSDGIGTGSEFVVRLPAAPDQPPAPFQSSGT